MTWWDICACCLVMWQDIGILMLLYNMAGYITDIGDAGHDIVAAV